MKKKRLKYIWLSALMCLSVFTKAQNIKVEQLEKELISTEIPLEQIDILTEIFNEIRYQDPDAGLSIAKEISLISILKFPDKIVFGYNLLGLSYMDLEQNDSAMTYYQKGLVLAEENNDSLYLSKIYSNIGNVQFNIGEYDKGLDYWLQSAEIELSMGNLSDASISYFNLGAVSLQLGDFDKAEEYFLNTVSNTLEDDSEGLLLDAYANLGIVYFRKGKSLEAIKFFKEALVGYENSEDKDGLSRVYRGLAEVFQSKKEYGIAIDYDKKSLEYAFLIDNATNIKLAYKGLAESYKAMGNYQFAYENQKDFTAWNDTVIQRLNRNKMLEIQQKYDFDKTEKENKILTQEALITDLELDKNQEELNKSRIIIWSSIIGLILLVVLAFTLNNRNRIKQRANQLLQNANSIINEKNKDITASIQYASKIQEALLPTKESLGLFSDSFIMLKPKDIVSGDFYWYSKVKKKKIIAAVDCTGHGVPGAFMSMIGNTFLHEIVNERRITQPGIILDELRERVIKAMDQKGKTGSRRDGMDMSLCMIDEEAMTMEFAGANNPVYIIQNNQIIEIKGDKKPVGYMPERPEDFTNHSIKINKGDVVYLFSDGYADQFGGEKGKKFKYRRLRDLLLKNYRLAMSNQKEILDDTFNDWKGQLEQIDDVCVIGFRI